MAHIDMRDCIYSGPAGHLLSEYRSTIISVEVEGQRRRRCLRDIRSGTESQSQEVKRFSPRQEGLSACSLYSISSPLAATTRFGRIKIPGSYATQMASLAHTTLVLATPAQKRTIWRNWWEHWHRPGGMSLEVSNVLRADGRLVTDAECSKPRTIIRKRMSLKLVRTEGRRIGA
jgi:hypothetical protein